MKILGKLCLWPSSKRGPFLCRAPHLHPAALVGLQSEPAPETKCLSEFLYCAQLQAHPGGCGLHPVTLAEAVPYTSIWHESQKRSSFEEPMRSF